MLGKSQGEMSVDIPWFSARGIRRIYGRGDGFEIPSDENVILVFVRSEIYRRLTCDIDIWLRKDGRVFVRFFSSKQRIDPLSFELTGARIPSELKRGILLDESWVPQVLRDTYDEWIEECFDYPDGDF